MTARQFDSLDEMGKIKAIGYTGDKIAEREDATYYYNHYQIESFFIEEKIEKLPGGNSFFSPSHFSTNIQIAPYLQKIKASQ